MDLRRHEAVSAAFRSLLGSLATCAAIGALRPAHFSAQMLLIDDSVPPMSSRAFCGLQGGSSYVDQLADVVVEWRKNRVDPVTSRQQLGEDGVVPPLPSSVVSSGVITIDNSSKEHIQRVPIDQVDAFVASAVECHSQGDLHALKLSAQVFVDAIGGARGLLTLLGHAQTIGTVSVAPLTRSQCVQAFQRRRSPREPLSVGARALAKHCQRVVTTGGDAASAWGDSEMRGNDANKNTRALEVLERLLDGVVWKNVHALPPFSEDNSVVTMEIRDSKGYGARWEIRCSDEEGYSFRGFLEPPMTDGHAKGWKH